MGNTKGRYREEFPVGSKIRIADRENLQRFLENWKFHHPLQKEQLQYSDQSAIVAKVLFYHGGDELYELEGVPGLWHEQCLEAVT